MADDTRTAYRIVSIDPDVATHVRERRVDPQYGYPATSDVAGGYGPCRSCLRKFAVGADRRLLFSYDPFAGIDRYPDPGPVFIHENDCQPYEQVTSFPEELRDLDYTLEAYRFGPELTSLRRISGRDIDVHLQELLADREVDYIHVRNTEAGCFDLRVERLAKC